MKTIHRTWTVVGSTALIALALSNGCGDDKKKNDTDAGMDGGPMGSGGEGGGTGGMSGGTGGKGGAGGSAGKGTGGSIGTAGAAGMTPMITCTEPAPTDPVVCGGETCTAPTDFGNNPCIVPCCVNVGGKEMCASKSTANAFPTECSLPATPDPNCPDVDAMGNALKGCCNAEQHKCGIISTLRPGCITMSMLVTLPDPLMECTPPSTGGGDDGGTENPDAGK